MFIILHNHVFYDKTLTRDRSLASNRTKTQLWLKERQSKFLTVLTDGDEPSAIHGVQATPQNEKCDDVNRANRKYSVIDGGWHVSASFVGMGKKIKDN